MSGAGYLAVAPLADLRRWRDVEMACARDCRAWLRSEGYPTKLAGEAAACTLRVIGRHVANARALNRAVARRRRKVSEG